MSSSHGRKNKQVKPDAKSLGVWLKSARGDYTQEELALRVGCKKAYISKLERATLQRGGRAGAPTLEFLHKLSRALGVSIAEPLAALGYLKAGTMHTESHPVRLLRYYNELSPEDRVLAEEMVKALWAQRRVKAEDRNTKATTKKPVKTA